MRAIQTAPKDGTIEIILHTPCGLVLAASQIARALRDHQGRVVSVVPFAGVPRGSRTGPPTSRSASLGDEPPRLTWPPTHRR